MTRNGHRTQRTTGVTSGSQKNRFSFRAECEIDVDRILHNFPTDYFIEISVDKDFPDTFGILYTNASLEEVLAHVKTLEDCHRIYQTMNFTEVYKGDIIRMD